MENLAQEELGALMLRGTENPFRLAHLDNLSLVHEDHTVSSRPGETHLV